MSDVPVSNVEKVEKTPKTGESAKGNDPAKEGT